MEQAWEKEANRINPRFVPGSVDSTLSELRSRKGDVVERSRVGTVSTHQIKVAVAFRKSLGTRRRGGLERQLVARLEAGIISEVSLVEKRRAFECRPFKRCMISEDCVVKLHCHVVGRENGIAKVRFVTKASHIKDGAFE
jgi:hypothetical protein